MLSAAVRVAPTLQRRDDVRGLKVAALAAAVPLSASALRRCREVFLTYSSGRGAEHSGVVDAADDATNQPFTLQRLRWALHALGLLLSDLDDDALLMDELGVLVATPCLRREGAMNLCNSAIDDSDAGAASSSGPAVAHAAVMLSFDDFVPLVRRCIVTQRGAVPPALFDTIAAPRGPDHNQAAGFAMVRMSQLEKALADVGLASLFNADEMFDKRTGDVVAPPRSSVVGHEAVEPLPTMTITSAEPQPSHEPTPFPDAATPSTSPFAAAPRCATAS